ncbi:MAG TPA: hypothetical protein VJZ91_05660 [Blastocatellia bacterium]|nr:hypothetical protein [Blastocatellia bacterium]
MNCLKLNRLRHRAGWGWTLGLFFAAILLTASTAPVGSQTAQATFNINLGDVPSPASIRVLGASADDHLSGNGTPDTFSTFPRAHALAVGDFNHDGFQDVVIGAPDTDFTPQGGTLRQNAGAVYVIFGRQTFPASAILDTNLAATSQPDISVFGASADDAAGFAVAAGDVNGDGVDDIIIGAPGVDSSTGTPAVQLANAGAVYVIFGAANLTSRRVDLSTANPVNVFITGENANDLFGSALAVGEVNGGTDTTSDLLVGAPGSGGPAPVAPARANSGAAFLFQGGTGLANTTATTRRIDLAVAPTPATVRVYGRAGSQFGAAVAIGDVNAGGAADLIVGAPQSSRPDQAGDVAGTGAVFAIFGGSNVIPVAPATSRTIDLGQAGLTTLRLAIYGASANDHLGASVAAGNIRGGGVTDLVMGAPDADGPGDSRAGAGEVYVLAGGAELNPAIDASERRIDVSLGTVNLTVYGAAAGDHIGETVAVSRINTQGSSDSIADLLIGAPAVASDRGAVYAFFGGSNLFFLATRDLALGQNDLTVTGEANGDELGWAIAAGDLDNNRGGDLILGAPFADFTGRADAGKVYVLLASAENVPPVNQPPVVTVTAPNGNETVLGGLTFQITWTASDPNGDNTIDHFDIFLSTDGGATFNTKINTSGPIAGDARTFTWNVPTGLNTTAARIRVIATDTGGLTGQDDSNANFTISDAGIGVTLVAPNGGEVLTPGSVFTIRWTVPDALAAQVRGFDLFMATDGQNFNIPITAVNPTQPALPSTAREFAWTVGNFCTMHARVLVRATSVTGAISTDASNGEFTIANPGPTIDLGNESAFIADNFIAVFRATTINNQEVVFQQGLTVEISTDETGTTFFSPTKLSIKKNGRKLQLKGLINGQEIGTFWPDNAIRIVRFNNPNCGTTVLRLRRVGNFLVSAPALDGVGTQSVQ